MILLPGSKRVISVSNRAKRLVALDGLPTSAHLALQFFGGNKFDVEIVLHSRDLSRACRNR